MRGFLFIDSALIDIHTITSSLLPNVHYYKFDYYNDTLDTLLAVLDHKKPVSVGIMQHNFGNTPTWNCVNQDSDKQILEDVINLDPGLASWGPYIRFMNALKKKGVKHLDMMECSLYSNPNWQYIIDNLEIITGLDIRASVDNTGSLTGSNWILETDDINLKSVYFTDNIDNYKTILGFGSHTAIIRGGRLYTFGSNTYGQLGLGDTTNRLIPTLVDSDTTWTSVSCGPDHTVAIKGGKLYTFGRNNIGQLGLGDTANRHLPTQVGSDTTWSSVSCGESHTVAIKGGQLYTFGNNDSGQLGLGNTTNQTSPIQVGTDTTWTVVACGRKYTIAIKGGQLYSFGSNTDGQLGLGDNTNRTNPTQVGTDTTWTNVACGNAHTAAIKAGRLYTFGLNNFGQLGIGSLVNMYIPTQIGSDTTWTIVQCGETHTVGIKSGNLYSFGNNSVGQLGTSNNTLYTTPVLINSSIAWSEIQTGGYHTIAIKNNTTYIFGYNEFGQLGLNDTSNRNVPTQLIIQTTISNLIIANTTYSNTLYSFISPLTNSDATINYISSNVFIANFLNNTSANISIYKAGAVTITASVPLNDRYSAASTSASFNIAKANGTITGLSNSSTTYGVNPDNFYYFNGIVSNSGGLVTYISGNTQIAEFANVTVPNISIYRAGNLTITASLNPTDQYTGTSVTSNLSIYKGNAIITGLASGNIVYNTNENIYSFTGVSTNSDANITYVSSDNTIAEFLSQSVPNISIYKSGQVIVTATVPETTKYNSRTVNASLDILRANASIAGLSNNVTTYGVNSNQFTFFGITKTSDANIIYASGNTLVADFVDPNISTLTIYRAGNVQITANLPQTDRYTNTSANATLTINKATTNITGFNNANTVYGSDYIFTNTTTNSTGNITYTSANIQIADFLDTNIANVTIYKAGTVQLTASVSETDNYTANSTNATLNISRANANINGVLNANIIYNNISNYYTFSDATSNSDANIVYTSGNTLIANFIDNTIPNITIYHAGTVTVTASVPETSKYTAESISGTLNIARANPIISGLYGANVVYGDNSNIYTFSGISTNSNSNIVYSSGNTLIADFLNTSVPNITIYRTGTVTVTASVPQTIDYNANSISVNLNIAKATATITGLAETNIVYGDNSNMYTFTGVGTNSTANIVYTSGNSLIANFLNSNVPTATIYRAGNLTVYASVQQTDNYTNAIQSANLVISRASAIVTGLTSSNIVYGDNSNMYTFTGVATNSDGNIVYTSGNSLIANFLDSSVPNITVYRAGNLSVYASVQQTDNYTSYTSQASLNVGRATGTVTGLTSANIVYGDNGNMYTFTGVATNSDGNIIYTSGNSLIANFLDSSVPNITVYRAGNLSVYASVQQTDNYTSYTSQASLNIDRAIPTVTGLTSANIVYGDNGNMYTFTGVATNSDGNIVYTSGNSLIANFLDSSVPNITVYRAGNLSVTASVQQTDNYTSYTSQASLNIDRAIPTVTGLTSANTIYGVNSNMYTFFGVSTNSNGTIVYTTGNTSIANFINNTISTVSIYRAGNVTINATVQQTDNYTSYNAQSVLNIDRATPTVTGLSSANIVYGDNGNMYTFTGLGTNSDANIIYTSGNSLIANFLDSSVPNITVYRAGNLSVYASVPETDNYTSYTSYANLNIDRAIPTVTGLSSANIVYGDNSNMYTFTGVSTNSDANIIYSSGNSLIANFLDSSVPNITVYRAGNLSVYASVQQTDNYTSYSAQASLNIDRATPTITGFVSANIIYGANGNLYTFTGVGTNSDANIIYSSGNGLIADFTDSSVPNITIYQSGQVTVNASVPETDNYNAASVNANLIIGKSTPSITGLNSANIVYGDNSNMYTFTGVGTNSDANIIYSSGNTLIANFIDSSVPNITVYHAGNISVTASVPETSTYNSATLSAYLNIARANATVTGLSSANTIYGVNSNQYTFFGVSTNSNGSIYYTTGNTSIANFINNTIPTVSIYRAGNVTINATVQQTDDYTSYTAQSVLNITRASPSLSGFSSANVVYGDNSNMYTFTGVSTNSDANIIYTSGNTIVANFLDSSVPNITIYRAGQVTVTASVQQTDNYETNMVQSELNIVKANASIYNLDGANIVYGDNGNMYTFYGVGTNSDGNIVYTSGNTIVANFTDSSVPNITIYRTGNVIVTASLSETLNYTSISSTASLNILRANANIDGFSSANVVYGDNANYYSFYGVGTNSDANIIYTSGNTIIANFLDSSLPNITVYRAGQVTLTASVQQTDNYETNMVQSELNIVKANASIYNLDGANIVYGDNSNIYTFYGVGTNSNGNIVYTSGNTTVANFLDSSVPNITIYQAGVVPVIASVSETDNYFSNSVSKNLNVQRITPNITGLVDIHTIYNSNSNHYLFANVYTNSVSNIIYTSSNTLVGNFLDSTVPNITIYSSGYVIVTASVSETTNYNATSVTSNLVIDQANTYISGLSGANVVYGDNNNDYTFSGIVTNSDAILSYTSSNVIVANFMDNTVPNITIYRSGVTQITASVPDTSNYTDQSVSVTLSVSRATGNVNGLSASSTIFNPNNNYYSFSGVVTNSDANIIYTSGNTFIANFLDNTVPNLIIYRAGNVQINAEVPQTDKYSSAIQSDTLSISKASASITSMPNINILYGSGVYTLSPPSKVGDALITYTSSNPNIASLANQFISNININQAGITTITASMEETENYTVASTSFALTVDRASPIIDWVSISGLATIYGNSTYNFPAANSVTNVSYSSGNIAVASFTNATIPNLTIHQSGTSEITASVPQTTNYTAGFITRTLTVSKATSIINWPVTLATTYSTTPYIFTDATCNSTSPISYASSNTAIASFANPNSPSITIHQAGTVTITASVVENANYTSASVVKTLLIDKATPTITLGSSNIIVTYSSTPYVFTTPITDSDGSISYTSSNILVANVLSGTSLTMYKAGGVIITVTVGETTNWYSYSRNISFTIMKAHSYISGLSNSTIIFSGAPYAISGITTNSDDIIYYESSDILTAHFDIATSPTFVVVRPGTVTFTASVAETDRYLATSVTAVYTISVNLTNVTINAVDFMALLNNISPDLSNTDISNISGNLSPLTALTDLQRLQLLNHVNNRNINEILLISVAGSTIASYLNIKGDINIPPIINNIRFNVIVPAIAGTLLVPAVINIPSISEGFFVPSNIDEPFTLKYNGVDIGTFCKFVDGNKRLVGNVWQSYVNGSSFLVDGIQTYIYVGSGVGFQNEPLLCFHSSTKILCVGGNGQEFYKSITEIEPGDMVQTLNCGPKMVEYIGTKQIINNPDSPYNCLYKCNNGSSDLCLTGRHGLLLDDNNNNVLTRRFKRLVNKTIEGRLVVESCKLPYFSKLTDRDCHRIYHIVLYSEIPTHQYGIYSNGLLSESISKIQFLKVYREYKSIYDKPRRLLRK